MRENISLEALQEKLTFVSLSAITMIDIQNGSAASQHDAAVQLMIHPQCVDLGLGMDMSEECSIG